MVTTKQCKGGIISKYPNVIIIILNWNGKDDTIECLESLKHVTYPNYAILLVDNGSADGSVKCFREQYPEIEIIENGKNLGFAEGNNMGIRRAMERGADYVLLLNNDTVVDPEFLGELVKVGEADKKIGIVGPKIYLYTEPTKIQTVGGEIKFYKRKSFNIGYGQKDNNQFNKLSEREFVTGCVMLIKINLLRKIGLFDTIYFAYWEDVDLCLRVKKAGYKIFYSPKSRIWHKGLASTGGNLNKKAFCYDVRNSMLFYYKNSSKIYFIIYLAYFLSIFLLLLTGYCLIYNKKYLLKSYFFGLKNFMHIVRNKIDN